MLRFAVCDDEPFMLEQLAGRLENYMKESDIPCQILRCANGRELLELMGVEGEKAGKRPAGSCAASREKTGLDLILLDIEMAHPDGMETARLLRDQGWEGLLIFVTVLKERVFDSFEMQPFDYLVKPVSEERFAGTMNRAVRRLQQDTGLSLLVQKGTSRHVIPFSRIQYCEVMGRKVYIHREKGQVLDYYDKLDGLQQRVDGRFFRCHRSFLVNLDYVRSCEGGLVRLEGGSEIPLS
ncbi:MAG: response regulator transcription factor, partial [Lachnospiraceae bacterium]|nr:response regulator transcription factor [Lachnospiraceae bacterium]